MIFSDIKAETVYHQYHLHKRNFLKVYYGRMEMTLGKKSRKRVSKKKGEHTNKSNTDLLNKMVIIIILMSNLWRFNQMKQARMQDSNILM